ncbi:Probable RNA-directed DNA polymerase from transposon X-element [Anthophora plagiata]
MLINETRLNEKIKLKIKNYKCLRKDKGSIGGGLAILIRNNIPHKEVVINENVPFEHLGIKLATNVHIIVVYNSPKQNYTAKDLDKLLNISDKVILSGDLNARHTAWNCHINNSRGEILYKYTLNNNCSVMFPDEPTHFPENGTTPTTIDIGINKNVPNISDLQSLSELTSDHNPIVFTISSQIKTINSNKAFDYDRADWNKFQKLLDKKVKLTPNINTKEDMKQEVQRFTDNIKDCIEKTIPTKTMQQIKDALPSYIINMIKDKNKMRRKWQRTRIVEFKKLMKRKTNDIRMAIVTHRNNTWTNKLQKLNTNDNSLWRMTKIFKSEFQTIPTLAKNNNEAITDMEKANMLASQFEEIHSTDLNNNTTEQNEIISQVNQFMQDTSNEEWHKYIASPTEIKDIIKKLSPRKAPGADNIQNIILKHLGRKPIVQLTYIINASIKLAHYPSQWKTGKIVPILKPGKNKIDPSSYRPISLLPTMSKITERVILKRLCEFENKKSIVNDHQFGFRKRHSTVQQVVRITNDISINYNKNNITVMLLLDIQKAFDRVWIDGLIYKMINHQFPIPLVKFINSYLRNRHLQVEVNGYKSSKRAIKAGVPQGSVLGPNLFNIYINDIPSFTKTKLALFADDTAIYAHSFNAVVAAKQIQIHVDLLEKYYEKWKIVLNASKTEVIVYKRKHQGTKIYQPIRVYNHKTHPTDVVKYLGVYLDSKLLFKQHIKQAIRKAYFIQKKLYPLMVPNSPLTNHNKKLIYKMILRPTLLYACPVWCSASLSNIRPLQIYQNKCLRLILSESRYARISHLHEKTEIPMIIDYIKDLAQHFYQTQLDNNILTQDITKIRSHNPPFTLKHKLPYQALQLFNE